MQSGGAVHGDLSRGATGTSGVQYRESLSSGAVRAASREPSSTKTSNGGKILMLLIVLLIVGVIALFVSYFVAVPAYLTSKFQKDKFQVEFLKLSEFNLLPNNDTHVHMKVQMKIPRVYYGSRAVEIQTMSGFSPLYITIFKPTLLQEIESRSDDKMVTADVDLHVKYKTPEYFQKIFLAFTALPRGLPYTVGTFYFQFNSKLSLDGVLKYDHYPAFRVLNLTGLSLRKFISQYIPNFEASKKPVFKVQNLKAETTQLGLSMDLKVEHSIENMPTEIKQTSPYHLHVDGRPFLEIGFTPFSLAKKVIETKLCFQFLDLANVESLLIYVISIIKRKNIPPIRLVHSVGGLRAMSVEPVPSMNETLFSSLILYPLPKEAQTAAARLTKEMDGSEREERKLDFSLKSLCIDDGNSLWLDVNVKVTPELLQKESLYHIERFAIDTGISVLLLDKSTPFLKVNVSWLQGSGTGASNFIQFKLATSFFEGTLAYSAFEAFVNALVYKTADFTAYVKAAAFSTSSIKPEDCAWCNLIQKTPIPIPLEAISTLAKSKNANGGSKPSFSQYLHKVRSRSKCARFHVKTVSIGQEDWNSLQGFIRLPDFPTCLKVGSLSFEIFVDSCPLIHSDLSLRSETDGIQVTFRWKNVKLNLLERFLPQLIQAYFAKNAEPPKGTLYLRNIRMGHEYSSAIPIMENPLKEGLSISKVSEWLKERFPLSQIVQLLPMIDFSLYTEEEMPLTLHSISAKEVSMELLLYLKSPLPISSIKQAYASFKLTNEREPFATIEFPDVSYDGSAGQQRLRLPVKVTGELFKLIPWIQGWIRVLRDGETPTVGIQDLRFGDTKESAETVLDELTPALLAEILEILKGLGMSPNRLFRKNIVLRSSQTKVDMPDFSILSFLDKCLTPGMMASDENPNLMAEFCMSAQFWLKTIDEMINGDGEVSQVQGKHCFAANEKPVKFEFNQSNSALSIILLDCHKTDRPLKFRAPGYDVTFFVNNVEASQMKLSQAIVTNKNKVKVKVDAQFLSDVPSFENGVMEFLDALSTHISEGLPPSEFSPFSYSVKTMGGTQFSKHLLNPPFAARLAETKSPLDFLKYFIRKPQLGIGYLRFDTDSTGFHLSFEIVYSIFPFTFSFSLPNLGFNINRHGNPLVRIELNQIALSGVSITARLSLLLVRGSIEILHTTLQELIDKKVKPGTHSVSHWYFGPKRIEMQDVTARQLPILGNGASFPFDISKAFKNFNETMASYSITPLSFSATTVRYRLTKVPSHSFKVPYGHVKALGKDMCLIFETQNAGLHAPVGYQSVIINVTTDGYFLPLSARNLRNTESIDDLFIGNSSKNFTKVIDQPLRIKKQLKQTVEGRIASKPTETSLNNDMFDDDFFQNDDLEPSPQDSLQDYAETSVHDAQEELQIKINNCGGSAFW